MIEDGGWSSGDELSTKWNDNPLGQQWRQKEGNLRWRRRRRTRNISHIILVIATIIFCSWNDENRIRPSARGLQGGKSLMHVASFAPPFVPRSSTLSRDNIIQRTSCSTNLHSKKKSTVLLEMSSSTTTVNTTSASAGLSTMSPNKSETKMGTAPIKSPIRISSGKNFIPPDKLDQLLDKVDIIALIESYGLQGFQRTSSLRATCLCPFHDDNNPSLQINGERGIYKCFSCGAGGNALKFVREYSEKYPEETRRLKGGIVDRNSNKPLTFVEAVRVLEDCASSMPMVGGVPMRQWSGSNGNSTSSNGSRAKKKALRQKVGSTSRSRILHANLFAAAYFEESLFGLPSAGSARMHLRTRGVHPSTVKAFAIGFAPESYFSGGAQQKRVWGEGSLVNRLRDEGFTPQEILDAGLAIVTRKGKEQQKQEQLKLQNNDHNETSSDENNNKVVEESQHEHKDYSTIMDRFRGRLVVPIFDATGTHVLGFGGRILEASQDANTDFKAAKYLNSPESLVFRKKELLFGQHMVKFDNAADSGVKASSKDAVKAMVQRRSRSLIIVEGYMDAIALWQAGVQETVASMGTALTKEQLLAAAEKARDIGGRVVLCLDNDAAGVAAVKRLCSGPDPILLSVMEESNIEIFVAELPESIKDPAEFLEEHCDTEEAPDEKFRAEVIDGAQEWSRWYMNSLIIENESVASNITADDDGGFSQLFDKIAAFLSVFEDVDDRMKKAAAIAPKLADFIDPEKANDDNDFNRTEISSTTRIQLASDLIEKAANIAHMKSMQSQRNYGLTSINEAIVPKSLEIGNDMSLEERSRSKSLEFGNDVSLEEGSRNKGNSKKSPQSPKLGTPENGERSSKWQQEPPNRTQRTQMKRDNNVKRFQKSMTKHISGVSANPFDDEWLGVTKDMYTNERNPLRFELKSSSKSSNKKYVGPETAVRFNKNDYHGTWTTPYSMAAGYVSQPNSKSLDFLERGTSSLIESDGEDQSLFVEDLFFTILARFSGARESLYQSIRISEASGSGSDVQWSVPEKEWLFQCLVSEIDKIPPEIVGQENISELRSYLSLRPDAFPGAFSSTAENVSEENSNLKNRKETEESAKPLPIVDVSVDAVQASSDTDKPPIAQRNPNYEGDIEFSGEVVTKPFGQQSISSIPKIPALGEDFSNFAQTDGMPDFGEDFGGYDMPMGFGDIDDALIDSVGPIIDPFDESGSQEHAGETMPINTPSTGVITGNFSADDSETVGKAEIVHESDKTELVDATLVDNEEEEDVDSVQEGSLDRLFVEGAEFCDIFNKYYADEDLMSLGSNEDKANFAVQDLYTILQFTTVLKRVEAGQVYMRENKENWFNSTSIENYQTSASESDDSSEAISIRKNIELLEYCSSQNADVGLRSDLRRLRNLADKNNQATERILAMMEAEFTDRSADVRGYSWLGNVLKFNEMKAMEWNDIIEGKENFRYSEEGLEVLEDIAYSDWRELSDTNEMFEFDKHVDLNHRSPFADLVMERPGSESPDAFAERYQAEWDVELWEHEYDQNHQQGGEILFEGAQPEAYKVDEYTEEISDYQQEVYEVDEYPEEISGHQEEAYEVDEYPEEISGHQQEAYEVGEYPEEIPEYYEPDLGDYGN